ncbi:Multifunctional cytochrome P450 monooxygenase [Colletotrichum siamense]|uniref:Multifunctional cytochrome P450 monooxygenase n=1 Tax=Colletotrichum siamense TaxID=690259 RepID=UPI001872512F|nr:Multifunctional cytochrome P450 monooxygenase [Colletotrichum siamense]KAF5495364.1 Multifunctional cytochrome P450 monooxygenase [Colletotrichum siamense]
MAVITWPILAILGLVAYTVYHHATKPRGKLPPGPKPLPLLGNIRDFPPNGVPEHLHWIKHKDLYGPISSVTVMGITLVIVNDRQMAHDLLDQDAVKTSGRPTMEMAGKLCGYENVLLCQGYTPDYLRRRKFVHQELGTKASAAQFLDVQVAEVGRQLVRSLREPDDLLRHFKKAAAATSLKVTYGYTVEPHKPDALVDMIEKALTEFAIAASPMAWAVDIFPALRHLPENFPGATFQKKAKQWRKSIQSSAYIPLEFVKNQMANFTSPTCFVSKTVQQLGVGDDGNLSAEDEDAVLWAACSLYGASTDTTVIVLTSFALAMLKFPDVQRKAQEEIDRVIGTGRLPGFEDREKLPYVDALVKEALRWWPLTPMGFPHTATEDFEFEGYDIPKGAMILPSVYWFLHDPEVHADPDTFDPDRFLPPRNEPDSHTEAFGYGRRICVGKVFADNSLYLNIAQTIAAFNFSWAVGEDGKEIEVDVQPKPGVLMYGTDFKFKVTPRSEKHVELIKQLERKYPFVASNAAQLSDPKDFVVRY